MSGAPRAGCRAPSCLALAVLVAGTLACERRVAPPNAPPPGPPPPARVEAVFPPARSTGVVYDAPVWVQFAVPIDTATASERTVFFKADTRRLPIRLLWDLAARRLQIVPLERLALRQTYTVELAPALRFEDGSTLGQSYAWQFTTNSLRRPQSPLPMDGQDAQSPFVALRWGGLTEGSAGAVTYEIHAGDDSVAAADPAGPALAFQPAGPFLPRARWGQDAPTYWAVHALNTTTGERLVGPVWRFEALPAGTPYDSVVVAVLDWNWIEQSSPGRQRCTEDSLVMGPTMISVIRWDLGPPDTTVRLAGAAIEMTPRRSTVPAVTGPSAWSAKAAFITCNLGFPEIPSDAVTGRLADATVLRTDRIAFSSDALTAHLETTLRLGGLYGYQFKAPLRRSYYGPGAGDRSVRATLWLHRYQVPAPGSGSRAPFAVRARGR